MTLEEVLLNKIREASEADTIVLSDRTIKDTIEIYGMPEEDGVDEFVEKITPLFKTVAGQSRAILAKAKEEKDKELERLKLESTKGDLGVPQSQTTKEDKTTNMELLESLKNTIEEQNKRFDSMNEELLKIKTREAKYKVKQELETYAKQRGMNDSYVLDKAMEYMSLDGEEDVATLKKTLESTYSSEFKKCRSSEPTYSGSKGGGVDDDAEWDAFFKAKEEDEKYFTQKD